MIFLVSLSPGIRGTAAHKEVSDGRLMMEHMLEPTLIIESIHDPTLGQPQ